MFQISFLVFSTSPYLLVNRSIDRILNGNIYKFRWKKTSKSYVQRQPSIPAGFTSVLDG